MKKLLAVSFCTTLVLGFAASAFAIHMTPEAETSPVVAKGGLITLDGSIRHRGVINTTGTGSDDPQKAAYDTRVRLGTTVKTGDQVTGRVVLESGSGDHDTYTWGMPDGFATLHEGGTKKGEVDILEAWIQYVPANWGIKVGHMPLALGNKLFFDHTKFGDDAIVGFINPNEATHLAALTIKFEEDLYGVLGIPGGGVNSNSDDINGYVLLGTYKAGAMNFGANYTYLNDYRIDLKFSNIGLTADLDVANFKIKGDLEFQTGDSPDGLLGDVADGKKGSPGGWAGMLEASTTVGGAWTLGGIVAYGSGDDDSTDNDVDQFVNFLSDVRYLSTMNGYILPSPAYSQNGGFNGGIQNQMEVQLYAATNTVCPLSGKDLSLKARLNYMKINEEMGVQKDDIGTEIELFADWKLAQGLVYGVEGAYLFTGDAWKYDSATNTNLSGMDDNVWFLRHRLELTW